MQLFVKGGTFVDSLMKYIMRTHRCFNMYCDDLLAEDGITAPQCRYIVRICREPGQTQEQLARRVFANKSNAARQMAALEQNGFITREPDPDDRRALRIFPTEKCLAIFPKVECVYEKWNRYLLDGFSEEEQELLFAVMEKMTDRALNYSEAEQLQDDTSNQEVK